MNCPMSVAQKYQAKPGHGQNLTYLSLLSLKRGIYDFSRGLVLCFSRYGLLSGIFEKMDLARVLSGQTMAD